MATATAIGTPVAPTATALLPSPTASPVPSPTGTPGPRVAIHGYTFYVEVAATPEERAQGLMHRESLAADEGMLFVYESDGRPGFWMKNMLIPLDILWLDAAGQIAGIEENVPPQGAAVSPPLYYPPRPVRYVLEVPAGTAARLALKAGMRATFLDVAGDT